MSVSETTPANGVARDATIRWTAAATVLAGVFPGGSLFLRPLLDVQLNTPENTALSLGQALGRLLFLGALIGVHLVYGHAYGLVGRIVVWSLAVLTAVSLVSLLFTFGLVEAGSPLGAVGNIATPLSLLLVSILGIILWLADADRWAAGLLIAIFPLGIVFGMLQAVPALTPLAGAVVGLAFIALGFDLWQKAQSRTVPA
ncbi:MAG: hypothetical protein ACRDG7_14930 [Candidatus Limnocylindria bacterium]